MHNKKKIVIVGATSSIAEHCARLWQEQETVELVLVGRDLQRTSRVAADLKVRNPQSQISVVKGEFLDPAAIYKTVTEICTARPVDLVLIAHGSLPVQDKCQTDIQKCHDALEVNGISPVLYAEAFAHEMEKHGRGTLAMISSVAGDKGRKSNYVYGAAKGMVSRYAQGLQHRFANSPVRVVLIKPGPTETPMTAHLKGTGSKLATVEAVARRIVKGIEAGKPVIYAPAKWRLIMMVIRHLPDFVFNKMNI